jgi:uncharacterized membrane protein YcaP (DUF421 family)
MADLLDHFLKLIGANLEPRELTFLQISIRGLVVFIAALIMIRLADRRFFARKSAFDVILGFILASMLARAVNGNSSFFPTLGGGFVLVGLHRLLGKIACHSHFFGKLVKGEESILIKDGSMQRATMRRNDITEHDLLEDLRLNGNVTEPGEVQTARLERSGQISVIKRKH